RTGDARLDTAALVVRVFELLTGPADPGTTGNTLKRIKAADPALRDRLLGWLRQDPVPGRRPSGSAVFQYQQLLLGGMSTDPALLDLVLDLAPDPRGQLQLGQLLAQRNQRDNAATCARRALSGAPGDFAVVVGAQQLLSLCGQPAAGVEVLREAEPRVPYPARRELRRRLYQALQGSLPLQAMWQPGTPPPGGPPQPGAPAPTGVPPPQLSPALAEEQQRRLAAAGPDAGFALADLQAFVGDRAAAKAGYAALHRDTAEPATRFAAWLGLAEYDPAAAWSALGTAEAVLADEGLAGTGLRSILLVALARAGGLSDAERVEKLAASVKVDPEMRAVLAAVWLQADDSDRAVTALAGADVKAAWEAMQEVLQARLFNGDLRLSPRLRGAGGTALRRLAGATETVAGFRAKVLERFPELPQP
ncbi:MAG: hypothetical protein HYU66_10650, partial [Armatimonadetes bacterium]|nr:hypothetical protein [Armatimonadota bacterium]